MLGSVAAGAWEKCAPAALIGRPPAALNFTVSCHEARAGIAVLHNAWCV